MATYLERDSAQIGAVQDLMRFENFMRLLAGRTGLGGRVLWDKPLKDAKWA